MIAWGIATESDQATEAAPSRQPRRPGYRLRLGHDADQGCQLRSHQEQQIGQLENVQGKKQAANAKDRAYGFEWTQRRPYMNRLFKYPN